MTHYILGKKESKMPLGFKLRKLGGEWGSKVAGRFGKESSWVRGLRNIKVTISTR